MAGTRITLRAMLSKVYPTRSGRSGIAATGDLFSTLPATIDQSAANEGAETLAKATWNGAVLAESSETEIVEGNHYFPEDAVNREFFQESETQTICSWKGVASYYDVVVDGEVNRDAAWYYPEPSEAASNITNRVAFWNGVTVRD